jgi:hypothetical protein
MSYFHFYQLPGTLVHSSFYILILQTEKSVAIHIDTKDTKIKIFNIKR